MFIKKVIAKMKFQKNQQSADSDSEDMWLFITNDVCEQTREKVVLFSPLCRQGNVTLHFCTRNYAFTPPTSSHTLSSNPCSPSFIKKVEKLFFEICCIAIDLSLTVNHKFYINILWQLLTRTRLHYRC